MTGHLQREIEKIKKEILSLGALVEDRFKKAVSSIRTEDLVLAQQIIDTDFEVDELEIEIEEECLKILALYQPVATDLRVLVAIIKINNDLERIADLKPLLKIPTSSGMIILPWENRQLKCSG